MIFNADRPFKKIALWLTIIIIVVAVSWFGVKVMMVDGNYSLDERLAHVFGWGTSEEDSNKSSVSDNTSMNLDKNKPEDKEELMSSLGPITSAPTDNCTVNYGYLMLINPNFTVGTDFIEARQGELISLSEKYSIYDMNVWNGDNLLDSEAALHLNDMLSAYETDYPGHEMQTSSCFRLAETDCGRMCMPTGTSDHQTGMSCDLIDVAYGTSLDMNSNEQHIEWQWLQQNSYKYGFINRFPNNWTGGLVSEPMNVDQSGTTGLLEAWHYRYVGVDFATEIAIGKYNNGQYDSLEHYLKSRKLVTDLEGGKCSDS